MTPRISMMLLFSMLFVPHFATAQQSESASQVVTFGVKLTNPTQQTAQTGEAEKERAQSGLDNSAIISSVREHAVKSRTMLYRNIQGKPALRNELPSQQSAPSVKVVTITD